LLLYSLLLFPYNLTWLELQCIATNISDAATNSMCKDTAFVLTAVSKSLGGHISDFWIYNIIQLESGIPQGNYLGPLPFSIFIYDIQLALSKASVSM
jgi:hypothetical protein